MDFTLRQNNSERNRTIQKGVLILVLVDFTLRQRTRPFLFSRGSTVLILVLVDFTLRLKGLQQEGTKLITS